MSWFCMVITSTLIVVTVGGLTVGAARSLKATSCVFQDCTCGSDKTDYLNEFYDYEQEIADSNGYYNSVIKCNRFTETNGNLEHDSMANESMIQNDTGRQMMPRDFPVRIGSNMSVFKIAILDMAGLEITNIPAYRFINLDINIADLSNNVIVYVDENAFINTTRLDVLDLSNNRISDLPENGFKPIQKTLVQLSLKVNELNQMRFNKLSSILGNLTKLRLLYLDRNGFTSLPDLSRMSTTLEDLSLCHNFLETLTDPLTGESLLPASLKYLQLSNNKLKVLTSKTFEHLHNLKYLYLGSNQIAHVDSNAFAHLTRLNALYLGRNNLRQIPSRAFYNLISLQRLDLAEQKQPLTKIDDYAFDRRSNTIAIRKIDLSGNRIYHMSNKVFCSNNKFHPYANVRELDLSGNELERMNSSCLWRQMAKGYAEYDNNQHDLSGYVFVNHYHFEQKPIVSYKSFGLSAGQDSSSSAERSKLKCDCEVEKSGYFVELVGMCEDADGELVKIDEYKCKNRNSTDKKAFKKYAESECFAKLEFDCSYAINSNHRILEMISSSRRIELSVYLVVFNIFSYFY